MNCYVYILYSQKRSRYYIGQTLSIEKRLEKHNNGFVTSTKSGLPWQLIISFKVENRSEAIKLERKIKKRGAKRFIEDNQFGV